MLNTEYIFPYPAFEIAVFARKDCNKYHLVFFSFWDYTNLTHVTLQDYYGASKNLLQL